MASLRSNMFPEESGFLVKPLYEISEIVIEKKTSEDLFKELFMILFEFFSDRKDFRSIQDVDKIMKNINEFITKNDPNNKFLDDKEKEQHSELFLETFSHFINQNEEKINLIFKNEKYHPFLSNWFMNLETGLEILEESFELFRSKKKRIIRTSSRAVDVLFNHFLRLIKAVFLVLYRIVEQLYMISENIPFDQEDEIDYLLNDIVYLENIQRQVNSSLK